MKNLRWQPHVLRFLAPLGMTRAALGITARPARIFIMRGIKGEVVGRIICYIQRLATGSWSR